MSEASPLTGTRSSIQPGKVSERVLKQWELRGGEEKRRREEKTPLSEVRADTFSESTSPSPEHSAGLKPRKTHGSGELYRSGALNLDRSDNVGLDAPLYNEWKFLLTFCVELSRLCLILLFPFIKIVRMKTLRCKKIK